MAWNREKALNETIQRYINVLASGKTITPSGLKQHRTPGIPEDVMYEAIGILISDGLAYRSEYLQPSSHANFRGTQRLKNMKDQGLIEGYISGKSTFEGAWHPAIEKVSRDPFSRGRYDSAIMEATKCLEVAIRDASGLPKSMIGSKLAVEAFKPGGPLYVATNEDKEDSGFQFLAQGIVLAFRNPTHHYDTGYSSPIEAGQILAFISFMMTVVEKRNPNQESSGDADETTGA